MSRSVSLFLVLVLAGTVACGSAPTASNGIFDAPGAPAQVIHVVDAYAGGSHQRDSLVVDSSSGRWTLHRCGPISAGGAICEEGFTQLFTGDVIAPLRFTLFERARRADFRRLRLRYERSGVTPPDLVAHTLHVIQNGQRQTVSWESGAQIPDAIESLLCRLEQARGGFVNCAD